MNFFFSFPFIAYLKHVTAIIFLCKYFYVNRFTLIRTSIGMLPQRKGCVYDMSHSFHNFPSGLLLCLTRSVPFLPFLLNLL